MAKILVSGAASGIGLETARALVQRGHQVIGGFHRRQPEPCAGIDWVPLDVTDSDSCRRAVARADALDVLINNAGIHFASTLETIEEAQFRQLVDVNLFGTWQLTRAAIPHLRASKDARVLMITSLSALVGLPTDGAYAASKFAVQGLSQSLRHELGPWNIQVATLCPGPFATRLTEQEDTANPAIDADDPWPDYLASQRSGSGEKPSVAAEEIVNWVECRTLPMQIPIGNIARDVFAALGLDSGERATSVAQNASGLDWLR